LLPETAESLQALSSFKEIDLAEHLKAWEQARSARLKHLQLQFTEPQLSLVEKAIAKALPEVYRSTSGNPNRRSEAVFYICKTFLEKEREK